MNDAPNGAAQEAAMAIETMLREDAPRLLRPKAPVVESIPAPEPEPVVEQPKIDHTLLPLDALDQVSLALMVGRERHGAWTWKEQPKAWTEILAKTQRHIFSFQRGEMVDSTTGLYHVSCAIANLMFLQSHILTGKGTDDRFVS